MVLRNDKVQPTGNSVIKGTVSIVQKENFGYQLTVQLAIHIPGVEYTLAKDIVEKAHQICPYSNAVRGNIDVALMIV